MVMPNSGYCICEQASTASNAGDVAFQADFASAFEHTQIVACGTAQCTDAPKPAMLEVEYSQDGVSWMSLGHLSSFGDGRVALKPLSGKVTLAAGAPCHVRVKITSDAETDPALDFFTITALELDS